VGEVTGPAPAKRRRSRRRTVAWVLGVLLVVVLVLLVGATWYVSNLLIDRMSIKDYSDDLPDTVVDADAQTLTLEMDEDPATDERGIAIAGVQFGDSDAYLQVGPVTSTDGSQVTRSVTTVLGDPPPAGTSARVEYDYFPGDPQVGLGLDFTEVQVETPLGPTPAWYVPADGDTWAIYSHGRGATRGEGLRMLATTHALGMPTLLVTFRDDLVGQPEDGISNFGMTEWEDLEAAVQYALDNGAQDVVLLAASTGGAISLSFLESSDLADAVVGMAFDAPVTSFGQTVDLGAAEMGVPPFLVAAGKWLTEQRVNLDFEQTDYVSRVDDLDVPTLIIHGTADETNPIEASEEFAATAPAGVVRLEEIDGAAHVWAWNTDRERFEQVLTEHLQQVLAG
jgi:pimeloyl-ACP methyl ester carboxylesterase